MPSLRTKHQQLPREGVALIDKNIKLIILNNLLTSYKQLGHEISKLLLDFVPSSTIQSHDYHMTLVPTHMIHSITS